MDKIERLLTKAIEHHYYIRFTYDGHKRRVQPHHYGLLNDQLQLHAYQVSNGSKTGNIPNWRNFELVQIREIILEKQIFIERIDYNPSNSHYSTIVKSVSKLHW